MSSEEMAVSETREAISAQGPGLPVGYRYRARDHYVVGREKIREFARAVQDHHPVHWSEDAGADHGYGGLIAPLTFFSVPGFLAQSEMFASVMTGYDLSQIMQTDQVIRYYRPIRHTDALFFEVRLESFRQAFGGDLMGFRTSVTDRDGRPVLVSHTSIVGRTGVESGLTEIGSGILMHGFRPGTEQEPSPARPPADNALWEELVVDSIPSTPVSRHARAFETVTAGDDLQPRTVRLTAGDLVNYAGVSGDPNPIHWSGAVAGLAELDSPVAHGMLTIGIGAGYVTSWLGDPGAVREYAVRLTSPVHVTAEGADIEYSGKVKTVDPVNRTATIALTARHGGRRIFGRATAVVQLR
ncbi:fused (3R)-hydroxyacyl-ACP dehydratase subunits HadA/HadB [Nocardia sp. NBC_01329]|uniref:fused (3R)-hydroxyacyl-ACP dehydratase subunits HadA/HadB n=1 Tax=Nocardia sp. NBC_01329 TaxID=2903594 RepID=UPI002E0E24EA|nr:fused (3R)-hydroxyacyl-ACP dehydratase subunits HadA/HadB [Nocardia sp. NBC_01329]